TALHATPLEAPAAARGARRVGVQCGPFRRFAIWTLALSLPLILGLCAVLAPLEAIDVLLVTLFALNTLWVAAAAVTALMGARDEEAAAARDRAPTHWHPKDRAAVLYLICGEDPWEVAERIAAMATDLDRAGLGDVTDIWLLSDTPEDKLDAEKVALATLTQRGAVRYRRRADNSRRKPGNLADWIETHGTHYETMLVMDADSTMTAARLRDLRYRMACAPGLGLLQSGIALRPAETRFGRLQRLSTRLTGPVFGRGLAAWSGSAGNYWGHNALIRVGAFRAVMHLPALSGPAPYGGDFLSHDFIEAAWLVRAGWAVEIAPDTRGSSEEAPGDLRSFHRRDRRWCQGNLQHLRAIAAPGLSAVSRLHLALGIQSYLSSPIWLTIILLFLLAGMAPGAVPVLSGALALLLVPKVAALARFWQRTRLRGRRRVFLRATGAELLLSTLVSPLVMVRQSLAVASVVAGQDSGWKRPGKRAPVALPPGTVEAAVGLALVLIVLLWGETAGQALWLTLICGPLLAAPWLVPWLDTRPE
ncbi:MAG: glucans biosynthesis glucosyltransferase MdoH, partial [Pseudomonadota bacterium]